MRFVGGYTGQVSTLLGCGGRDGGKVLAQGSENEFPFRAVLKRDLRCGVSYTGLS